MLQPLKKQQQPKIKNTVDLQQNIYSGGQRQRRVKYRRILGKIGGLSGIQLTTAFLCERTTFQVKQNCIRLLDVTAWKQLRLINQYV